MFVFRNVQLTEWLVVFVDVPNQVSLSCFIWHFVNPIEMETGPEPETEMVFSQSSPPQQ